MESGKVSFEKITIGKPKSIKSGSVSPILYDGKPLKIHLKYALFEVFENSWGGKSAKIVDISITDLENLREIRDYIISLTRFPPKDFNLLRKEHIFAKLEKTTRFWKSEPKASSFSNFPGCSARLKNLSSSSSGAGAGAGSEARKSSSSSTSPNGRASQFCNSSSP